MHPFGDHIVGDDQFAPDRRRDDGCVVEQSPGAGVVRDLAQSRDEGGFAGHTSVTAAKPATSTIRNDMATSVSRFSMKAWIGSP